MGFTRAIYKINPKHLDNEITFNFPSVFRTFTFELLFMFLHRILITCVARLTNMLQDSVFPWVGYEKRQLKNSTELI